MAAQLRGRRNARLASSACLPGAQARCEAQSVQASRPAAGDRPPVQRAIAARAPCPACSLCLPMRNRMRSACMLQDAGGLAPPAGGHWAWRRAGGPVPAPAAADGRILLSLCPGGLDHSLIKVKLATGQSVLMDPFCSGVGPWGLSGAGLRRLCGSRRYLTRRCRSFRLLDTRARGWMTSRCGRPVQGRAVCAFLQQGSGVRGADRASPEPGAAGRGGGGRRRLVHARSG